MMGRTARIRPGLTLLEVVVSLFIFLIAVTAIWQLMAAATDRAIDVKLQTQTSLHCQSKLAEVMIGDQPLAKTGGYQPWPDSEDQNLEWKMEADPAKSSQSDVVGLWEVKIWVRLKTPSGGFVESLLSQMVLEPTLRGSTMDRPEPPPAPTPTEDEPAPK